MWLPRQFLFYSRFSIVDFGHVWMLVRGHINRMCGETPTDLRMGVPAPRAKFVGLTVTLTKMQRKAAINSRYQSGRDARELEDWLEAKPQRFAMLGINADSYNVVAWVTSHISIPLDNWWLNRKQQAASTNSLDTLVEETRKTSLLHNLRDDVINTMLGLTQGNMSYADYSQLLNDFSRRSRQPLTYDLPCIRFISGLAKFQFQTQAKFHRSQQRGFKLPLVELQKFLNDLVTHSPHLGRARPATTEWTTPRGG
jgi:hypothetical protein